MNKIYLSFEDSLIMPELVKIGSLKRKNYGSNLAF